MRFLVDECTGPQVAQWLREHQHEVFSVYDEARGMTDEAIHEKAISENWIIVTIDKDFGERIFRDGIPHHGVVFLRLANERVANKIAVLERLLAGHAEKLADAFVVVSEGGVRIAGEPRNP